jgi:hypothetical protein
MEQKDSKIFDKTTMQAVSAFCDANNIKDKDEFIYLCFKQGFDIKKFGLLGETGIVGEKQVEIEVIREIRVEVPVEVIKEVEKIVEVEKIIEVPVEIIKNVERIVEVPVEVERIVQVPVETVLTKVEYVSDKSGESELLLKIQQLESDKQLFSTITIEMENNFQNEMSKKDKELDELRRNLDEKDKTEKLKLLQETLQTLRGEIQQKNEQIKELEKINRDLLNGNQNQAYLLRGSNLNRRI